MFLSFPTLFALKRFNCNNKVPSQILLSSRLRMTGGLKLTDYDLIGIDLDNTLLEYNLSKLFQLQYDFLSKYMVEKKGYSRIHFPPLLTEKDADFFQRGLFLDFTRGNVLYPSHDGVILKASRGTKKLSDEQIADMYGADKKWSVLNEFITNKLSIWDKSCARTFLDFTDSIAALIFAKGVDTAVGGYNKQIHSVWPDVFEAIVEMYKTDSFYMKTLTSNFFEYAYPCEQYTVDWLWKLKNHAILLLITGSDPETARKRLEFCLGDKYRSIFYLVICSAKKPGFFFKQRPFINAEGIELSEISLSKTSDNSFYENGNWYSIQKVLKNKLQRKPKCLYIGDNPLQDVYAPSQISGLDTIAVVEEIASEGLIPDNQNYPHQIYVSSKFWGPFLSSSPGNLTLIGSVIKESALITVPSLKSVASKAIDFNHQSDCF